VNKQYLWLVQQRYNIGYDTYDGFVCVAPTKEVAQQMLPSSWPEEDAKWARDTEWAPVEQVFVTLLGTAAPGMEQGIILTSFNAG